MATVSQLRESLSVNAALPYPVHLMDGFHYGLRFQAASQQLFIEQSGGIAGHRLTYGPVRLDDPRLARLCPGPALNQALSQLRESSQS